MNFNIPKLQNHLRVRWMHGCPMCKGNNWSIDDRIQTYVPMDENKVLHYGKGNVFPVVLVKCGECGFVATISPVLAGALEE